VPVRFATLEERLFHDLISAPGEWQAGSELVITAASAGMLEGLTVAVGDRVTAGQRLGTLVPSDSWASLTGAELLVREARDAAGRAEAQRALALARKDLVRVPLVASQAGVVVRRSAEPGSHLAESAEIVAIAPWRSVVFEAHVPVADAKRIHAGEAASITAPNEPARAAAVQRVLPMASEADQTVIVWLSPRSLTPTPELDRFATADITVGAPRTALAAPDSAVIEDDLTGQRRLAVVDGSGRMTWKQVNLGLAEGSWREVSAPGLAAGARIVTQGHRGLPDGTKVAPAP
jgi:multidrug efflux pump subunit AcrA (membrane-fusion protein)